MFKNQIPIGMIQLKIASTCLNSVLFKVQKLYHTEAWKKKCNDQAVKGYVFYLSTTIVSWKTAFRQTSTFKPLNVLRYY